MDINKAANLIKNDIENAIENLIVNGSKIKKKTGKPFKNGLDAKTSLIRSSSLINHLHEWVKHELLKSDINPKTIFPPLNNTKPELKITGLYKQKDQDICVKPLNIPNEKIEITWGPMANSGLHCNFGRKLSEEILSINVRSQLSSLSKNSDTLFERTIAEALNLHDSYPRMVLGEVYMIPVFEYNDNTMSERKVTFKENQTDLEKYINFFHYLSGRKNTNEDPHIYERCALIIIDFKQNPAKVYQSSKELIDNGLIRPNFPLEYADISATKFVDDLLKIYNERFNNKSIYL